MRKVRESRAPPAGVGDSFRTSVSVPVTAAAAAMAGLTRCVRPPLPCEEREQRRMPQLAC